MLQIWPSTLTVLVLKNTTVDLKKGIESRFPSPQPEWMGLMGFQQAPIDMGTTIPVDWEINRYAHYVDHGTYDKYLIYEYDHMIIVNGLMHVPMGT